MSTNARCVLIAGVLFAVISLPRPANAGMPAVLPSSWTSDSDHSTSQPQPASIRWQVQALSFFMVAILGSAKLVQFTWNAARRDITALPRLGYGRSLSLVVLWGLMFVIVLAMISGARELMTPGAWQKQGWTYQLKESEPASGGAVSTGGPRIPGHIWVSQVRTSISQFHGTSHYTRGFSKGSFHYS